MAHRAMPAPRASASKAFSAVRGSDSPAQPPARHTAGKEGRTRPATARPRRQKSAACRACFGAASWAQPPSCYDMHAAGGSIPLIRPAEYTPLSYRTSPNFARKQEKSVCPCALRARVIKYPCCGNLFSSPVLFREEPVWKTVHFRSLAAMCSTTAPCARGCRRKYINRCGASATRGEQWDPRVADVVADAMKNWAMQLGATHYIHWFIPLTGAGAGKHDSFIDGVREGEPITRFSGKMLVKGGKRRLVLPFGRAARHL